MAQITEIFDKAKKLFDNGDLNNGYTVKGGRIFHTYYTNHEWNEYVDTMPKAIKDQFDKGKGGEMKEYTRNGKTYPPKMASYGSSSRFMISIGQSINGFEYEKQLQTGLGGYPANLDGYLKEKCIYVEAKCHEFYNYSRPSVREGHKKLFDGIKPLLNGKLNYIIQNEKLYLSWNDKDTGHFDLKQMLCHLSGIANAVLNDEVVKKVNFIYLIYSPSEVLLNFVENESYKQIIKELYEEEETFIQTIDFKSIYGAILNYFNKERYSDKEISEMLSSFNFIFCTQDNFKTIVDNL